MITEQRTCGLVSVIMPSYNTAKYIEKAIRSVIFQTYSDWELLIVDDCSTDNTDDVVRQFLSDERITYLKNERNLGAAISRNKALSKARGRWVAFLDSDDFWDEKKIENHLKFMQERKSVFSCTSYNVVDENYKLIKKFNTKKDKLKYKDILRSCRIGCSTVIYDVNKIGKVYMPEKAVKREDFACWLQILKHVPVDFFHEYLTTYLCRENSVSANKFKLVKDQWNVYRKIEKISLLKSIYYIICWAINGFFKYK